MDIDTRLLQYIFNHVIFPPKLPQRSEEEEGNGCNSGPPFLYFVREVLESFISKSSPLSQGTLEVVTNMLDTWIKVDSGDAISEDLLAQVIADLKIHGK